MTVVKFAYIEKLKMHILSRLFISLLLFVIATPFAIAQERIPMTLEESGIYTVPCEVNGLKLRFVFDTGASEVHLSLIEAAFMLKNGYIEKDDFIGKGEYSMADGTIEDNSIVNLKEIKIGNVVIKNVTACISSNVKASLLLGQSAIRKLGPYRINGDFLILDNHSIKDLNGFRKLTDALGNEYNGFVSNGVYEGQGKMLYTNGKTYEGEWSLGKRNGYGVLKRKNGDIEYEGEWKEDKKHGRGTSYGILGNKYVGNFANDSKFGKGIYYTSDGDSIVAVWKIGYYDCTGTEYYKNGETLSGTWVDGYKEGKFIHTYPNGKRVEEQFKKDYLVNTKILNGTSLENNNSNDAEIYEHFTGKGKKEFKDGVYIGEFVNGRRQGCGTMTYKKGAIYKGNWDFDHFEGKGTYTWESGDKYVGDFQNGWRQGSGVYTWPNGDKYVGQFAKSKISGKGKMTYASGGSYDGDWADGKWHGSGDVIYDNGDEYIGQFVDGQRKGDGTIYYKSGNKYEGRWLKNQFEGYGTYSWKNGDKYVGNFKNGLRNGYGSYTWSDGNRYDGYWLDNKQNGSGTYYYAEGGSKKGNWKDGVYQSTSSYNSSSSNYNTSSNSYADNTTSYSENYGSTYDGAKTYNYIPKSYYTAYTTTALNLREGPSKSYDAILTIPEGEIVFMETSERYNDFAKVMYIKTGEEGYVSSSFLDGYTKVKVNEEGSLEVTGKTYSKYAEINLKNDANVTAKITIGNNSYTLSPNTSKKVKYIEGGTYNIIASSPGIVPYVGVDQVEGGYEYSWRFYIKTIIK